MDRCVALIVLAFSSDPAARWLYKDPQAYMENFPRFARAFGGAAFDHGGAHYVEGAAAALWLPPGAQSDEEAMLGLVEGSVPASDLPNFFGVMEKMAQAHPQEPHWYLPLIGTDPVRQCQGHGSALLGHALAICDEQKLPAYLEATNPRNVALYRRHGFELMSTIQVGNSPTITPMLRRPR
ncbi:MAG: GNAT family N-acetyltransferase [Methyloceanibacter sp.]